MDVTSIISALITGVLALVGIVYTNSQSNKKIEQQIITAQKITDVKLDNLTAAVEKHNKPAERVPIIEEKVNTLETRVDKLEGRVNSLDRRKP